MIILTLIRVILNAIKNIDEVPLKDDEDNLEKTRVKIEKLGAINLAAIDELKENEERKSYLDRQYDDLTKSIDTLEAAIKKLILKQDLNSRKRSIQLTTILNIFSLKYLVVVKLF